jgi:hypothetical protein
MSRRQIIDLGLSKLVSRKLLVFLIACVGLFTGNLDGGDWTVIAGVFIGTQGVIDSIKEIYKAKGGGYFSEVIDK